MAGKYDKNIKITVDDKGSLKQTTKDIDKLDKAHKRVNNSSQTFDRNAKGNAKMSANASKNFSKQAQGMQGVLVPAYAELAARVFAVTAAFNALSGAANYSILLKGQEAYAKQTGKSLSGISKIIQKASKHMLSYKEAATSAALATTSGLTTKQIEKMTEAALGASVALGRNMSDSMDRLTRGIVKAEPEILDELGIIIRLDNVYKEYADSIGVATASLSEYEKMQARTNVILGQAETKYGDIGKAIDGNQFEVLGASILDIARDASSGLADFFSPIAKFLSDSTVLLAALMTLILKNVLGTALPALKGLGAGIKQVPKDLEKLTGRMDKWTENIQKRVSDKKLKVINTQNMEKEFKRTISTFAKLSPKVAEAMSKGLKGRKFVNAITLAMRASIGHAIKNVNAGNMDFGGMLKGKSAAEVSQVNSQFRELIGATKDVGKQMGGLRALNLAEWVTGLGKGFTSVGASVALATSNIVMFNAALYSTTSASGFTAGLNELKGALALDFKNLTGLNWNLAKFKSNFTGFGSALIKGSKQMDLFSTSVIKGSFSLMKLWGSLKLVSKAVTGFATVAMSGVLSSMNMLVGLISTVAMAAWALDWLGIGSAINKAKDELDGYTEGLEKLSKDSQNLKVFGPSFSEARAQLDRDFNLAERLETELKNVSEIDIDGALTGIWNTIYASTANIFTVGVGESLADSLTATISASQALNQPLSEGAIAKLSTMGIDDSIFKKISEGVKLTTDELTDLQDDIDDYIGTLGFYVQTDSKFVQDIQKGIKGTASATKEKLEETKRSYDEMADAGKIFFKEQRDLGRAFVEDTPFTKYADSFANMVTRLGKLSGDAKISYLMEQGLLDPTKGQSAAITEYIKLSKGAEDSTKSMNAAARQGDLEAQKHFTDRVNTYRAQIKELGASIDAELLEKFKGVDNLLSTLIGLDPAQMEEDFRNMQIRIDELTRSKDKLKKLGVDDTSEVVLKAQEGVVRLKLKELRNSRKILLLDREKNEDQIAITNRQLILEDQKLRAIRKNNQAVAEYNNEALGGVITLSEKWDNIFKDFGEWDSLESLAEFEALEAQRVHEFAVAFSALEKTLKPSIVEGNNLESTLDIINVRFGEGSASATKYIEVWKQLNTELGKFQTLMSNKAFDESQAGVAAHNKFVLASTGAETSSEFYKSTLLGDKLRAEEQKQLRTLKQKNPLGTPEQIASLMAPMLSAHKEILKSAKIRFKLERKIAKVNSINSRRKAISEERTNLELQAANWKETSTLLELRQATAKIERDYAEEGLDFKKKELRQDEIMLAYSKLKFELFEAKKEEAVAAFESMASAYKNVASTISIGIGEAVSSVIMGKETDQDWREIVAQSLADSAGGLVSNVVDEQLTGRKGFIANLFPEGDLKTAIFGAEDPSVQLGKDMNSLAKMAEGAGLKVRIVEGQPGLKASPSVEKVEEFKSVVPAIKEDIKDGWDWLKGKFKGTSSYRDMTTEEYLASSVAGTNDPKMDKIIRDILNQKNIDKYRANQEFLKDIWDFKWGVNKDKFKPWHKSTVNEFKYNRTLTGMQHPESVQKAMNWKTLNDFKVHGGPLKGIQTPLPFTGPGIPTNSTVGVKLLPILDKLSGVLTAIWPSELAVDPMAKPYVKPTDPNQPLGSYGPTASELNDGNVLEMFWNMGLRIGEKINEAIGVTDPTNSIDKLKAPQTFEYNNPYSVDANSALGQRLEQLVLKTPTLELQNAALTAAIDASNGREGSTKVEVVNSEDIKTDAVVQPGQSLPTVNPKGDATIDTMSKDLRQSMASNLHAQIMNDNMNARSLITNSLSTVGSNLMSSAIGSIFGLANGGVVSGGFRAFANGGTVTKPTLGLVGEGKYNEAVVPLPDGRSIPVMGATGSTENNVTVNVTIDSDGNAKADTNSGMDGDQGKQLGYMVSQAVQAELVEQQRPGGLLSSY